MKLVSLTVCTRPDEVDVTNRVFLATLSDTSIVRNFSCQSIPRLTITLCLPKFLIPTEIKFGMLCEKTDVVNKSFPYEIKYLVWILNVVSFL